MLFSWFQKVHENMLRAKPSYRTTREKILVYRADCTTEIMGAILILVSTLLWRQDTEIKSSIGTQGSCRTQNKYSKDATQVKMHKPLYQVNLDMITYTSNLGMFCNFSLISFLLRVLISEKKPTRAFSTSILLEFNLGHWKKWWSNLIFAPKCFTMLETM